MTVLLVRRCFSHAWLYIAFACTLDVVCSVQGTTLSSRLDLPVAVHESRAAERYLPCPAIRAWRRRDDFEPMSTHDMKPLGSCNWKN